MNKWMLWILLLACSTMAYGQVPQAMNFQAVARNAGGNPLSEKVVGIKVEVLQGGTSGTVVYGETHRPTTAKNGVVNLQIGNGTAIEGTFAGIDWSRSPYYLRISMDTDGGTSYKEVVTQQMLAVPYALYAEKAGNSGGDAPAHNFIVVGDGESAHCLLTGAELLYESTWFDFEFSVSYMDGDDQEVEFTFEGLPEEAVLEKDQSASGKYGKFIYMEYNTDNVPAGEYPITLKLRNKYGVEKTGKLIWKTNGHNSSGPSDELTPSTFWQTDENVKMALAAIIGSYQEYKALNEAIDDAFMKKDGADAADGPYAVFTSKAYTPSTPELEALWGNAYTVITRCNGLIKGVSESTSSGITENVRTNALKQARAIRAYCHLMLTEWFGRVPLIQEVLEPNDAMNIAQSERDAVLTAVISDLEAAQDVTSLFDVPGEITSEEARILLLESRLLKKDWQAVSQVTDETSVAAFIKKVAVWKTDSTQPAEMSEASLMEEYMDSFHSSCHHGNLYLNVLEYSATYFDMDAYKALLPIPQSEQHKNPNIEQNDGYN